MCENIVFELPLAGSSETVFSLRGFSPKTRRSLFPNLSNFGSLRDL